MFRQISALIIYACFILITASGSFASQNVYVEGVKFREDGIVEVDLEDKTDKDAQIVWTKQETVSVRDASGREVKAEMRKHDDDTFFLMIPNFLTDGRYSFSVDNLNYGRHSKIRVTSYFVATPHWKAEYDGPVAPGSSSGEPIGKTTLYIGEMEFKKGNELEIDIDDAVGHDNQIRWDSKEKIIVADKDGKTYPVRVKKYDKDEIELQIDGLASGTKYGIEIRGILYRGDKVTLVAEFEASNGWEYKDPRKK
ncbi:MAG: hypothetical protein PHO18_02340 [Synergistaceae bacterium]|nr:hypothetical protein [Synergistaceae bacterium]